MFPAFVLAGFLVAFFKLQPFEKTVILDFFLENAHGFLEIVIDHFDFDFFQIYRPFLHIVCMQTKSCTDGYLKNLNYVEVDNYMKSG